MEMHSLWDIGLTAGLGFLVWWFKTHHEEMKRVSILVNKTREEVAKEYLTRADNTAAMDRVMARFDRVEEKLDRLVERK
jgi:hypothetical protein|tara:strand:- start:50 stop:286 length:237 start_codon:yes stop_codon:yes gene_type:complete